MVLRHFVRRWLDVRGAAVCQSHRVTHTCERANVRLGIVLQCIGVHFHVDECTLPDRFQCRCRITMPIAVGIF